MFDRNSEGSGVLSAAHKESLIKSLNLKNALISQRKCASFASLKMSEIGCLFNFHVSLTAMHQ